MPEQRGLGFALLPDTSPAKPSIAVLMPVHRPAPEYLRHAIDSVRQQTIDEWQLVIVDDASESEPVSEVLTRAERDPRITVLRLQENRGISGASNAGLEHVTAPLVALLDHDDFIEPEALEVVLAAAKDEPRAEVLYTDRDAVDERGIPTETFRKPDWSPQRLRGNMYIAHLTVLSAAAAREVGGFRSEFDGAQDHDIVLRITERGAPLVHIPTVLYHWRQLPQSTALDPGAKPYAAERGLAAVREHHERLGLSADVRHSPYPGFYLTERTPRPALVSLIIPTRGGSGPVHGGHRVFAVEAVRSIVAHEYACDYEIVVVHDSDADPAYLDQLRALAGDRLAVVGFDGPFNFSAKVNRGVEAARGEVIVLLNDDIEVISPRWLDHLVAISQEPDVGAVGAKLLFEDGTIQHAGHCFANGQVTHVSLGRPDGTGDFGSNVIDREVVGVTAAVLAQRTEVWEHVGGLDEGFPNNFNDVDYCNRVRSKGYRIVQANSMRLYHFESKTRHAVVADWEARRILDRLGDQLFDDRFTSPEAAEVGPGARSLREWVRVSSIVLREEGWESFSGKARRRLRRTRPR